jgi:hypothetical protein
LLFLFSSLSWKTMTHQQSKTFWCFDSIRIVEKICQIDEAKDNLFHQRS